MQGQCHHSTLELFIFSLVVIVTFKEASPGRKPSYQLPARQLKASIQRSKAHTPGKSVNILRVAGLDCREKLDKKRLDQLYKLIGRFDFMDLPFFILSSAF